MDVIRSLKLVRLSMLFDAVHHPSPVIRRAALWEVELDDVLATSFRAKADVFLEAGPVKDVLSQMAKPGNLIVGAAGEVGFSPALWDDFVRLSEESIGVPMGQEVKDQMASLFVREQVQSSAEVAKGAGLRVPGVGAVKNYNLPDVNATRQLENNNLFWVKTGGHRNVEPGLAKVTQEGLAKGLGRDAIAKNLKEQLGHLYDVETTRWSVVSSAAMNRARNFSRIREFDRLQIERVKFWNPQDKRTSDVCNALSGTEYETKTVLGVVQEVEASTTPEQVMDAQPWLSVKVDPETKEATWSQNTSGGAQEVVLDELKAAGKITPPLHGHCRSELIGVFTEETKEERRSWTETRAAEANVTVARNASSAASILAEQEKVVPAVADKYAVDELQRVVAVSDYGSEFMQESWTWNSTKEAFSLTANWSKKETGAMVGQWLIAADEASIGVVNAAMVRMASVTVERIGASVQKLAASKGVTARMVLPLGSHTSRSAEALLDWRFSADKAAQFKTWLQTKKIPERLKRMKVAFSPDWTMREMLRVRVNGSSPVQDFLRETSDAVFEWTP